VAVLGYPAGTRQASGLEQSGDRAGVLGGGGEVEGGPRAEAISRGGEKRSRRSGGGGGARWRLDKGYPSSTKPLRLGLWRRFDVFQGPQED
jgi:hypothetical protein